MEKFTPTANRTRANATGNAATNVKKFTPTAARTRDMSIVEERAGNLINKLAKQYMDASRLSSSISKDDYIKSIGLVDDGYTFEYETVGEYDAEIGRLNDQIRARAQETAANQKWWNYLGVAAAGGNVGEAMMQDQQREYNRGATNEYVKRREELVKQRELLMRRQKIADYGSVKSNPDYEQHSAVDLSNGDATYRWINDIDGYRGKAQDEYNRNVQSAAATANPDFPQGVAITTSQMMPDYYKYNYDMLNEDEVRTYNYLAATNPQRAAEFLEDMRTTLQKRQSLSEQADFSEAYDKASGAGKVAMNVASVPLNVIGNVMSAGNDVLETVKGEYSPYGSAHSLTNVSSTIRGATAQDIIDKIDEAGGSDTVGQLASNAYQAVMSGADSALGAALFGKGYLLVAGAGAASQKAKELYERGASGPQILTGAVTSGLIEVALEKIPLDNLLNAKAATKTVRGLVSSVLKQSGIEAMEETLTEVSNIVADCIIQGSNSELSNLQKQYESKGESSEAAYRHALRDKATDVAWSGFGGFISGGASGLTFSTAGLVQYNAELGRIGQSYIDGTDGHSVDEAISIGLDNAHTTEAYKLADAINKKVQSGQSVTAHEVGRMLVESSSAEAAKARALDHAVRESARQHGVAENIAEDVANIAAATGRTIEFADDAEFGVALEGDAVVAGSYDPSTGVVKINAAASSEDITSFLIKHELTHSVEGTEQYDQLTDIVQAQMGDDAFSDAVAQVMEERAASGQPIDMPAAEREVVADWIGDNLYKSGFAKAIVSGDATVGNAFVRTIDKLRLALGNKKSRANTQLKVVERLFMRALEQEVDLRKGDVEYAFKGYDSKTGKPIYESNFQIGTPKAAKAARILELIQTVWSKKPIELVIKDGEGQNRKIQAHFDPSYDAETGEQSDASKLMGGNRHGTASEQRVTLDLADDYYQIAADAVYNYSKDETGKDSVTHKGVSQWHYFINDILFQEYGKEEMTPFRVTINVKERSDGLFVYSFSAERQNKGSSTRQTLHADVTAVNNSSNARSNNSISEDVAKSNPQSKKYPQNAVVSRAWMMGDTTVDRAGNAVEPTARSTTTPVETAVRSQVQNGERAASAPASPLATPAVQTAAPRRVESVNYEALHKAVTVDDVIDAVGDSEAFRRAHLASQVERVRGTVDVDGQTMSADEYMAQEYHALPDDENTIRAAIKQTEAAIADELKQVVVSGRDSASPFSFDLSDHPNLLKLNIQLFAQKAKLEYVLDKGEEGSKTRRFFEQRLKGKDANHNQELVDLLAGRNETYNPIANEKTLDKANARLRDAKYADKLKRRILRYKPTDIFTDVDMAAAQVMINDAINAGELGEAADLIQGLSRKGTELGRAVQIMSMQARLTPEGTLRAMQRTLQKTADKVICDGASDSIDQVVDEIIGKIEALGGQRSASDGEGGRIPTDISGATREQLRDALVEDLAATDGNYLTKEDIGKLVDKAIDDSSNIPEQVRRYIKKHIKTGTLADRIYEMQQKGHLNNVTLRRSMEDALGLPTLTESEIATVVDLATQIHALDADPVQQAECMDELYDMLGRKLPVTAWEGITNWRKFGMLFNVKTHLRNIASNAAYSGVRKVDDLTATMIERLFVRDSSQWSKKLGWRKTEEGQALLTKIEKSADLAVLQMQKRGKYEYSGSPLENHRNLFGTSKLAETKFGKAADKASRWNSDMLEREDVIFFRPAYIDALGQIMTARHMTEVTPEVEAMAYQRAAEATFRADNVISDFISMLKQRGGKFRNFGAGMLDIAIPFNKTPANIATQSAWHSPIGIVKGALDLYNATKGKGSKTVADAINTMAKGMTGTALLVIGMLLGGIGHFNTGFGKTEKERAADELAGIQENAFVVGGMSISVDWLQPAAAPLIIGASMAERLQDEGLTFGTVFGSLMDGTDALFDLSMMQSMYDLFGGYDTGATATLGSVAENLISQSIPTIVGQTARSIDPVQRKTKGDSDFETMLNKILAKIPGLTYLLDPELDVWGDEVHRTGKATEWSWALNFLQQFALPFNTKVGTGTDSVSREIQRLYEGQGSAAVPTAITRDEAKDAGLDYVESNRTLGAVNRQAVEDFVNNKWPYTVQEEMPNGKRRNVTKFYEDMTDEERVRVLKRIYKKAKEQVTEADEANDAYFADIMRRLG